MVWGKKKKEKKIEIKNKEAKEGNEKYENKINC